MRKADFVATRAITIDVAPGQVWPWLVQVGSGRAGWCSYDRVDNAGRPSATAIISELQHLQAGDLVPMVAGKDVTRCAEVPVRLRTGRATPKWLVRALPADGGAGDTGPAGCGK